MIATIAQYMYHHHDSRLPTLATLLLKRVATVYPMSILACLGNDAEPIRDIYLARLQALTEVMHCFCDITAENHFPIITSLTYDLRFSLQFVEFFIKPCTQCPSLPLLEMTPIRDIYLVRLQALSEVIYYFCDAELQKLTC